MKKNYRLKNLVGTFLLELIPALPVLYLAKDFILAHPGFFIQAGIGYIISALIFIKRH